MTTTVERDAEMLHALVAELRTQLRYCRHRNENWRLRAAAWRRERNELMRRIEALER